jgi:ferritin-like metal-binding protein YciE
MPGQDLEESMLSELSPARTSVPTQYPQTRKLIMVSNRGPIEHWFDDAGRIRRRDAAGGVATALSSVARQQPVTWIASAGSDADRAIAILGQRSQIGRDSDLRLLDLPARAYDAYYGTFCNPILWFVQHSIGDRLHHEPKMAKAASDSQLQAAFTEHLAETKRQVQRLETIFKSLGVKPGSTTCKGMQGLIKEGEEMIKAKGDPAAIDAGLIAAAQRVEHYEIAGYGCVRTYARQLGETQDLAQLQTTLDEEGAADQKLSRLAESVINLEAER